MDDTPDPSAQFFPDVPLEDIDLYAVLNLVKTTTAAEIKKAYRTLALVHHPDKHANSPDTLKASSTLKFQQVGFAYAVLSDEKKRARYDQTGRTDEGGGLFGGDGEGGWEAYFEEMFEKVNRAKLDELKETYQGAELVFSPNVLMLTTIGAYFRVGGRNRGFTRSICQDQRIHRGHTERDTSLNGG